MKKILLPALIFTLSLPMLSYAASFDCTKAASATEKLICSNGEISKKDEELAKIYYDVNNKSIDNRFLISKQMEWLKERNKCNTDQCLIEKYIERMDVIGNWLENEKNIDDFFLYGKYIGGDHYSMSIYGDVVIDREYIYWSHGGRAGSKGGAKSNIL
jgi:uncharacterized protein